MSVDREVMQRWEILAQDANAVFAGHSLEDVGGALALLTAMLLVGVAQGEEDQSRQRMIWLTAQHGKLVLDLIPAFLEVVEERGGWDEMAKKGRH
jgi:hypothetical protein